MASTRTLLLTLGLAALVYGLFAHGSELWDRDEPRFARCAIEMVETGDYLVPRFRGELRPDKPALIYWLMAASSELFGRSEFAFRLPTILGMLCAAYCTYRAGRRLYDPATGALAAGIWLGALTPFYIGTVATADGVLLACTTAGFALLVARGTGSARRWDLSLGSAAIGLGLLAKGPVALAVIAFGALGIACFARRDKPLFAAGTGRLMVLASLIGFAMFAAWGLPANAASEGGLLERGIGKHVLERMVEPQEGHGGKNVWGWLLLLPAYAPITLLGLFPWGGLLPSALAALGRGAAAPRHILMGFALPTFILMSLVATKLPHYVLPAFPALAIAIAAFLRTTPALRPPRWVAAIGHTSAWLAAIVLATAFAGLGIALDDRIALASGALAALVAIWAALKTSAVLMGSNGQRAAYQLGGAAIALGLLLDLGLLPPLERAVKASDEVAAAIIAGAPRDIQVCTHGYGEPSLDFYLGQSAGRGTMGLRELAEREGFAPTIAGWAKAPGPGVLVTSLERLSKEGLAPDDVPATKLFERRVFNTASIKLSALRWTDLVVFRKG